MNIDWQKTERCARRAGASAAAREAARRPSARVWPCHVRVTSSALAPDAVGQLGDLLFFSCAHSLACGRCVSGRTTLSWLFLLSYPGIFD